MSDRLTQRRVIINADDFGFSQGISEGIIAAHRDGIVTSTTITANMPAAEAAVGMLAGLDGLGVGVHLNATQGPPLSREALALADDDGVMRRTGPGLIRACMLRPRLLDAVEAEFDAQIRWVLDQGIAPTHVDSHRHVHAYGPIFARVVHLAGKYHIPYVRRIGEKLPRGDWPDAPLGQRLVSRVLNVFAALAASKSSEVLATNGTWGVAHTGLIDRNFLVCAAGLVPPGLIEIMTHPGLPDGLEASQTRLIASRRAELEALCDPRVAEAFENNGVQRIHYGQV